jgi:hypothetical protein
MHAGLLTRRPLSAVTVLNSPQFHPGSVDADLARRKSPGAQFALGPCRNGYARASTVPMVPTVQRNRRSSTLQVKQLG